MGSGEVRYINGCCGTGAIAPITCDGGFQLVGDTITLLITQGVSCGYNPFDYVYVWAPSGDVYCGRGNDSFVLSFFPKMCLSFR